MVIGARQLISRVLGLRAFQQNRCKADILNARQRPARVAAQLPMARGLSNARERGVKPPRQDVCRDPVFMIACGPGRESPSGLTICRQLLIICRQKPRTADKNSYDVCARHE